MTCTVCHAPTDGALQCGRCRQGPDMKLPRASVEEPQPTRMTRPEREMARVLDALVRTGEVKAWWFECVKLKVGEPRSWYTPDFFVEYADGSYEFREVKGPYIREDARKSFKAAVLLHPWATWRMMSLDKGTWRTVYHVPARLREVA